MPAGTTAAATGGMTAAAFVFYDGGNDNSNNNYEYEWDDDCSHIYLHEGVPEPVEGALLNLFYDCLRFTEQRPNERCQNQIISVKKELNERGCACGTSSRFFVSNLKQLRSISNPFE